MDGCLNLNISDLWLKLDIMWLSINSIDWMCAPYWYLNDLAMWLVIISNRLLDNYWLDLFMSKSAWYLNIVWFMTSNLMMSCSMSIITVLWNFNISSVRRRNLNVLWMR